MWSDLLLIFDATLRMAVPLVLAAMGGVFAERSGVIDFGLEGKMLGGAFVAATVAHLTQSAWMGMLGAIIIGITFSMMHAFASVTKQGNQVVSCVAINIFAMGLTTVLGQAWFQRGGKTPQLPPEARFTTIELPFAEELRVVPVLGDIYYELISGHNILVYIAYIMVPLTAWIVFRSGVGHVPEDRQRMGLVTSFVAKENAILGYHRDEAYNRTIEMNESFMLEECSSKMKDYDVRPDNPELQSSLFSGGNQQKLVVMREMSRNPELLIVGQPTRGVDIGAIEFIHRRIITMRDVGKAVLLVSVELDEILSLSDRILVMFNGEMMGEISTEEADERKIGLLMAGIREEAA
jgi:ABC-type branched-subunit amino acid transport system ATPase component